MNVPVTMQVKLLLQFVSVKYQYYLKKFVMHFLEFFYLVITCATSEKLRLQDNVIYLLV